MSIKRFFIVMIFTSSKNNGFYEQSKNLCKYSTKIFKNYCNFNPDRVSNPVRVRGILINN